MQETWVQSLGWEDPLEKEVATHSSIFAWEIPWTEEPGGLSPGGYKRTGHNLKTKTTDNEYLNQHSLKYNPTIQIMGKVRNDWFGFSDWRNT